MRASPRRITTTANPPATDGDDPLSRLLIPPPSLSGKVAYYTRRYGLTHALCALGGRLSKRFWFVIAPIVTRRYLKKWLSARGPHILNLGGGGVLSDQWLTADISPRADVYMDLQERLPLRDGVVDGVYSEEVIEHLAKDVGRAMLLECLRVLKPAGVLRLTTPSLDFFASRVMTDATGGDHLNAIFYGHGHRFIYSEKALRQALSAVGFVNIRRSSYRDPQSKYGYFDSHPMRFAFAPPEWSQYWEAEKPQL